MSETRSLFKTTASLFFQTVPRKRPGIAGTASSLADRAAVARLHQRTDGVTDQAADYRTEQGDNEKLAPDSAAQMADGKEAQRHDESLEGGREDGANGSRDNADEHVTDTQIHCWDVRVRAWCIF